MAHLVSRWSLASCYRTVGHHLVAAQPQFILTARCVSSNRVLVAGSNESLGISGCLPLPEHAGFSESSMWAQ